MSEATQRAASELAAALHGSAILPDLVECGLSDLRSPETLRPWLDGFAYTLWKSATATSAIHRALHTTTCPGTRVTYHEILNAIRSDTAASCFLVGGQVRDVLCGKLSSDVDVAYSCSAQQVAQVCVQHGWWVKFKPVGSKDGQPNYVLIGDEDSDGYLEGFSLSFNAAAPCCHGDCARIHTRLVKPCAPQCLELPSMVPSYHACLL